MNALKLPSGKILNKDFFNDIIAVSTVMPVTEIGKSKFHTDINYIINITFIGINVLTLAYEREEIANTDRDIIENALSLLSRC